MVGRGGATMVCMRGLCFFTGWMVFVRSGLQGTGWLLSHASDAACPCQKKWDCDCLSWWFDIMAW